MDAFRSTVKVDTFTSVGLVRGQVVRLENSRGMALRVEHGKVWLTQSGSCDDVCLYAGDTYRIKRDGLTLVSTRGRCSLAIVTLERSIPAAPSLAQRIADGFWKCWAGLYAMPSRPCMPRL